MPSLLIKNGLLIDPASKTEHNGDLLIKNGRIAGVGPSLAIPPRTEIYPAAGLWVFPGFIDLHIHAREPGDEEAETLPTAARAAAAGGITSVLLMPNTRPPIDSPALLRKFIIKARRQSMVNMFFAAAATAGRKGKKLSPLKKLKAAGAAAFTDDGSSLSDPALLMAALKSAKHLKIPLLDHPEDFNLTGKGVIDESASRRFKLPAIAREAEIFAVLRDIFAAGSSGPIHLQHLSCAGSIAAVRAAKKLGLPITAETCPHYFSLTSDDIRRPDADFKMKPPLRREADRLAVIRGLADGTIDAIASDHAPHRAGDKALGFIKAPFGIIGLETMVPLALTELVGAGRISRLRLAELLSFNPAHILGLKTKGALKKGFDADLTIIDPRAIYRVPEIFFSKSSNSPFKGRSLKGRPAAVIVRGCFIFRNGKIL
ncbi:MAG TPA: dihydroorotase [Elusimicrobia bacterium]|nr:dihydroorotase [Elusimicrobiota bacterium]